MIRYFCYFTTWLACGLAMSAPAQASTTATTPAGQHFAPMEDWQLPSFVAQDGPQPAPSAASAPAKPSTASSASKTQVAFNSKSSSRSLPAFTSPAPAPASSLAKNSAKTPSRAKTLAHAVPSPAGPVPVDGPPSPFAHRGVTHAYPESFTQAAENARKEAEAIRKEASAAEHILAGRLARLTAYWAGEGDYYTEHHLSSTGIRLHGGLCAVDPSIIPYGSVVTIPGLGQFLAADTGSAVVSRAAAREAGKTLAEKGALVIDIFFDNPSEGEAFAAKEQKFVPISWWTPSSTSNAAQSARRVFADEDWNKIYSKQL